MSFVSGILGFLNRRTDGKSLDEIVNKRTGGQFKTLDELINTRADGISLSDILAGGVSFSNIATENVIKRLEAIQEALAAQTPTAYYPSLEPLKVFSTKPTKSGGYYRYIIPAEEIKYSGSAFVIIMCNNTNSSQLHACIDGTSVTFRIAGYASYVYTKTISLTAGSQASISIYDDSNYWYNDYLNCTIFIGATAK